MEHIEVAIIGGGLAGLCVGYQLARNDIEFIILEADRGFRIDKYYKGSAVPDKPAFSRIASYSLPYRFQTFMQGDANLAKSYIALAKAGIDEIKTSAQEMADTHQIALNTIIRESGGLAVGYGANGYAIHKELSDLLRLDPDLNDLRFVSRRYIREIFGTSADHFQNGILYPLALCVNLKRYLHLIRSSLAGLKSQVNKVQHYSARCEVSHVEMKNSGFEIGYIFNDGHKKKIEAKYLVIATNAFTEKLSFLGDSTLKKIKKQLTPWWAFSKCFHNEGPNTPYAWTFSGDPTDIYYCFTRQDNYLYVVGKDIKVAGGGWSTIEKNAYAKTEREIFNELSDWVKQHFNNARELASPIEHRGIYTETSDGLPIIGVLEDSRIIYFIGCNAVGLSVYSIGAKLIPGMIIPSAHKHAYQNYVDLLSPERRL